MPLALAIRSPAPWSPVFSYPPRCTPKMTRWQNQLLKLRHGEGPCLGKPEWQGSGHGQRLLHAARYALGGVPLHVRLPLTCQAAVSTLERAGFARMHVNAFDVASFEAPAEWDWPYVELKTN